MIHRANAIALSLFLMVALSSTGTASAQERSTRLDLGVQVTQMYVPKNVVGSVTYQPALGGICSVILTRIFAFDSTINFTPKAPLESTSFAGGRMTQAFFGA